MKTKEKKEIVQTADGWLMRMLANMPRPTCEPLAGWERIEPRMKGFRYSKETGDRLYSVFGGPRRGWAFHVRDTSNGNKILHIGNAAHLDYAMMGAEQAETLPRLITLAETERSSPAAHEWEVEYSGSLTQRTAMVLATHIPTRQSFAVGLLNRSFEQRGQFPFVAVYMLERSLFYPVTNHWHIHELGKQAVFAYLHDYGLLDEDDNLTISPADSTAPPILIQ